MNADGDETPEAAYRLLHERAVGQPPTPGERSLSAAQYDSARADHLSEKRIAAKPGAAIWPPTSQTLMKRLGNGSWSTAMTSLGLTTNSGRTRGTGSFSDDDYRSAVAEFLDAAADGDNRSVTSDSFAQYTAWAKERTAAGAKRPSGAAVRQHFGGWETAKTAARA